MHDDTGFASMASVVRLDAGRTGKRTGAVAMDHRAMGEGERADPAMGAAKPPRRRFAEEHTSRLIDELEMARALLVDEYRLARGERRHRVLTLLIRVDEMRARVGVADRTEIWTMFRDACREFEKGENT